jgi:hypothetical protein
MGSASTRGGTVGCLPPKHLLKDAERQGLRVEWGVQYSLVLCDGESAVVFKYCVLILVHAVIMCILWSISTTEHFVWLSLREITDPWCCLSGPRSHTIWPVESISSQGNTWIDQKGDKSYP